MSDETLVGATMRAERDAAWAEFRRQQDRIASLEHHNERLRRQAKLSSEYWIRAAEAALAGDERELRIRVGLAKRNLCRCSN